MKLPRRTFLKVAASGAALAAASCFARAQTYPTRPVHIVVGFPAGFTPDIIARLMSRGLSERLGQQFIVDNRPGAGSNVGTEIVVRAPADGYTLLLVTPPNVINAMIYDNLNFNFIRDVALVASIVRVPLVMTVNPSVPANTVPEFIAYAKANPGKINVASGGIGSSPHVAGELFKMMAGVDLVHVPYRINDMPDLLSGQVQVVFAPIPTVIGYIRAGKLRALAVTTATPSAALPDIPTVNEFLPGFEASSWDGVGVPTKTPTEIIDKLNKQINAVLTDPKLKERFADLGATVFGGSPAEFSKFIADETEKWGKVIKFANIKAE